MRLNEYRKRAHSMYSAEAYQKANHFIRLLRDYGDKLTEKQIRDLRNLALGGYLEQANVKLRIMLEEQKEGASDGR